MSLAGLASLRQLVLSSNRLRALGGPLGAPGGGALDPGAFLHLQSLDLSYNMLGPEDVLGPGSVLAMLPM